MNRVVIIKATDEIHKKLSHLGLKSKTYNDIMKRLITVCENFSYKDFSDEEAAYYNERIKLFESGKYEGTRKVDLNKIKSRKNRYYEN